MVRSFPPGPEYQVRGPAELVSDMGPRGRDQNIVEPVTVHGSSSAQCKTLIWYALPINSLKDQQPYQKNAALMNVNRAGVWGIYSISSCWRLPHTQFWLESILLNPGCAHMGANYPSGVIGVKD